MELTSKLRPGDAAEIHRAAMDFGRACGSVLTKTRWQAPSSTSSCTRRTSGARARSTTGSRMAAGSASSCSERLVPVIGARHESRRRGRGMRDRQGAVAALRRGRLGGCGAPRERCRSERRVMLGAARGTGRMAQRRDHTGRRRDRLLADEALTGPPIRRAAGPPSERDECTCRRGRRCPSSRSATVTARCGKRRRPPPGNWGGR